MATTTAQNFSDHLEIQQVINLYASAIDKHQWSALESVFTEDAEADFIGLGIFEGRQAIADLISAVLTQCSVTQHLLGNINIEVMVIELQRAVICQPSMSGSATTPQK